jgi:uncharacterized membrane protein (DUF2068 family)
MLTCARKGHVTYAPDEPGLRERLTSRTAAGEAWRCLRCGTFVLGAPLATGPAGKAPKVRRGKEIRGVLILRIFAVERLVRGIIVAAAAYAILRFPYHRTSIQQAFNRELPRLRPVFKRLGYDLDHSKLVSLIKHAFTLNATTLRWFAAGLAAYAAIEVVEAVGLWLARRWGEYFAMIATSAGLPIEIYELTHKITVLRVGAFAVNVALVAYLVYAKRLLGVRGGAKAYEARLRGESIIDTEANAAALAREGQPPGSLLARGDEPSRPPATLVPRDTAAPGTAPSRGESPDPRGGDGVEGTAPEAPATGLTEATNSPAAE